MDDKNITFDDFKTYFATQEEGEDPKHCFV